MGVKRHPDAFLGADQHKGRSATWRPFQRPQDTLTSTSVDSANLLMPARSREVAAGRARTGDLDPQQEKARKDKEYADHLAMRNAVARGDQVLVEDVVKALTDELAIIRSRLLAIPGKLGGRLKPDDRQAIETEIYEALSELSSVDSPDQVKDYATGRKPNRGRMAK